MKQAKHNLAALSPPGVDSAGELGTIYVLWALTGVNMLGRMIPFYEALQNLREHGGTLFSFWYYFTAPRYIFPVLVLPVMVIVSLLYLGAKIIAHYQSYRTGSRADYTMKRLPDKTEYHRRALAVPLFGLLVLIVIVAVTFAADVALYFWLAPAEGLPSMFRWPC